MSTFNITSSTLNSSYNYEDENVTVQGSFGKDAQTNTLQNVSGSVYLKGAAGTQGEYIGNFNGYLRDGEICYSVSEMSRRNQAKTWDAIDEIESAITGTNANSEE